MSHYAKIQNNRVVNVIVAEQDFIDNYAESGEWIQTSYNTRANVHYGPDGIPDGGVALRGNFAGYNYVYDREHDVFYEPQPYATWTLDTTTWTWQPPVPYPDDNKKYFWIDEIQQWISPTFLSNIG